MYRTLITVLNSPFPKKYNIQSTWHVHAASFKPNLSKSLSFSNLCLTDWTTHACMQLGLFCIFHWALVWNWVLFGSDNKIDFERGLGMCVSRALESGVEVRFWGGKGFIWQWVSGTQQCRCYHSLRCRLTKFGKMIPEMDNWIEWYQI